MNKSVTTEQTQCLCGAVQLDVQFNDRKFSSCHCSMCRRWTGGTFLVVECSTVSVHDNEPLGVYSSSEWGERCFCKNCGSTVMWRSKDGSHFAVSLQAFADPSSFEFVSQIFIDEKPTSYSFSEATQNLTGEEFIAMITSAEHKHD
jgi:hypothetical protein